MFVVSYLRIKNMGPQLLSAKKKQLKIGGRANFGGFWHFWSKLLKIALPLIFGPLYGH